MDPFYSKGVLFLNVLQGIATGKSIVHEAVHVMEFDETVTKLVKFTDYMDTAAYLYILTP